MEIKRLTFYFSAIALAFVLLTKALQASAGISATETSFHERYLFSVLLPEGWGFFTKNPRDEKKVLYQVLPDKSLRLATYKNSAPDNCFGFSRRSRRASLEFGRLMSTITEADWNRYAAYSLPELLHSDTIPAIQMRYTGHDFNQLAKGSYLVKRYALVPWAWAQYPEHYTNPEHYLKLTIN